MVKIYTGKGDDGTTGLWYGGRVPKHGPRPEAYGSLDEAASALGVARALCGADHAEVAETILDLQNGMFVAGAELATAPEASDRLEAGISRITAEMAAGLEAKIDSFMDRVDLPPRFTVPGGTALSASLDVARSAVRRAERRIVALRDSEGQGSEELLTYVNRASDLVFAMARFTDEDDPELFKGRGG